MIDIVSDRLTAILSVRSADARTQKYADLYHVRSITITMKVRSADARTQKYADLYHVRSITITMKVRSADARTHYADTPDARAFPFYCGQSTGHDIKSARANRFCSMRADAPGARAFRFCDGN